MTHDRQTSKPATPQDASARKRSAAHDAHALDPETVDESAARDNADADRLRPDEQLNESGQTEADGQGGSSLGVSDR